MLEHVWERAMQARYLTGVVIATDDARIEEAALAFRARVVMTRSDHASGTDRVAEAASASNAHIIVNIQGDEPLIDPAAIDAAILGLVEAEDAPMSTLAKRLDDTPEGRAAVRDPNVVKVVMDRHGDAIYFSRSPIPFVREAHDRAKFFKHIGLYVYRREFLLDYPDLPRGPLEAAEKLEQLRALENGHKIRVVETDYDSLGVDTPEDWQQVTELFNNTLIKNIGE
jgi:3-deoxy-manno-octulosonate cytidylyltransferase (CMP-KDO synthetase)